MRSDGRLRLRSGSSTSAEPHIAVAEIRHLIHREQPQLILFFCSPTYDLAKLAIELRGAFGDTLAVGCTTAGQFGSDGFIRNGIIAISLAGDIAAYSYAVELDALGVSVAGIAEETSRLLAVDPDPGAFGLLLSDGLSLMEEKLASLFYRRLPAVPVVGGSAGDDLRFKQVFVYVDGAFRAHSAAFILFRTFLPFRTIKFAHFETTELTVVVTLSDPDKRVVYEMNGEPAAKVYASLIGVPEEKLDAATFSSHPLILEMGGDHYVRSIAHASPDQSLKFFCAVEDGMVLSIGRVAAPLATAQAAFQRVRDEIGEPALVIGCDCILRRLEFEASGLSGAMGVIMKQNKVFGFNTYGEQYDGLHMNQTFTGIAIGSEYESN